VKDGNKFPSFSEKDYLSPAQLRFSTFKDVAGKLMLLERRSLMKLCNPETNQQDGSQIR
jgi:hypothetical protein